MVTEKQSPVSQEMRKQVLEELEKIEREYNVTIIYACESGSRAWGFESPDSDYDVRFIYVPKPDWYMQVESPRDVIERKITDDLDIAGWELRKALGLVRKSNPAVLEWLSSPVVYKSLDSVDRLREMAFKFYNPIATVAHHLGMATRNMDMHLSGLVVRPKKYLYVLRSLLSVLWVERYREFPPIQFTSLVTSLDIPAKVLDQIETMLDAKRVGGEAKEGDRNPVLDEFIKFKLANGKPSIDWNRYDDVDGLNAYLRETVTRYAQEETDVPATV